MSVCLPAAFILTCYIIYRDTTDLIQGTLGNDGMVIFCVTIMDYVDIIVRACFGYGIEWCHTECNKTNCWKVCPQLHIQHMYSNYYYLLGKDQVHFACLYMYMYTWA